jgi:AcrR family transcriptional regulator
MNPAADTRLRDRILGLADAKMLVLGQPQMSLRQIAVDLGVTPMAIYRHFANNEALQLCLLDIGFTRFGDYLARGRHGETPMARLRLMAEGFIQFAVDNPGHFELMFLSSQVPSGLRSRDAVLAAARPTYDVLQNAIEDCISAGDMQCQDAPRAARDMLAFCIGQAALYMSGIMNWSPEDAKLKCIEAFDRYVSALQAPKKP